MENKGFTHLHLHSQYSLLDGAITLDGLFHTCKKHGMDSVAVTDHGNMFGVIEFYNKANSHNIKPIIGIEAYIAPGSRLDKDKSSISDAAYHLILLAENNAGYKNLIKLASIGYLEGFYYRPRIDKEVLAQLSEGIICTSACFKGELATLLGRGDEKAAYAAAESYLKIFGPKNFFVEIQQHENDEINTMPALIDLANKLGIGLVATNDAHFLNEDDYDAHNALCCIGTGKTFEDPSRMIYPRDIFVKSSQQMRELFSGIEQACDNTLEIAKRCDVHIDLKTRHAPSFKPADGSTPEEFLTKLCYENAKKIYGDITETIKTRLDRELDVIESKGFSSYFLIVWDFCNYAHQNNIPVGARGSAVGTIVGYCLGLCDVDPLKYDLLFERFMDPHRNEMPDVDIDICQLNRSRVIEYVRNKYGHVAQIITFGTLKARAAIRDVCRVLNVPLAEADRLSKLVPDSLDMTLDKALETEPKLKDSYDHNPQTKKVIDIAKKLEGITRHASVHAAGVVIADEPLTNFIPLYKSPGEEGIITQIEGPMVEKAGLLKMDFLGLKTLTVLEHARQQVKQIHGKEIDLEKIDIKDKKVLKVFAEGKTKGIFQFESGGMQDLLIKMKPDRIEDLIAANALYRPGPMTLIPDYCDRKHGAKWQLPHPIMEEILTETYGIMVYQEQVMRICNRLGDIPLREAYTLIKAIGKKNLATIAKEKERFITGCSTKGLSQHQAEQIFELIERFAGYGFNKSHSTRYAFIAYQTAFLKAYYPLEFMASLLTYERSDQDKLVEYIGECRDMGIEVLPPDINESNVDFTPIYKGHSEDKNLVLRFGLAAVKGVGEKAVEQIITARQKTGKFLSLFHFCENVELRAANKQVLESLIKAGAFDRLGGNRAQMMAGLEKAMQTGSSVQSDKNSGQMNLFGQAAKETEYAADSDSLPNVPPWPEALMLTYEKEVLGFYVTSNPLSQHAETIDAYSNANTSELEKYPADKEIIIGGMITKIRSHVTKSGKNTGSRMAVFVLQDLQGTSEVVLFPESFNNFGDMLIEDKIVFIRGKVDHRREKPNIFAEEIISIERAALVLAAKVKIRIDTAELSKEKIIEIKSICQSHRGKSQVYISINSPKGKVLASVDRKFSVNPDAEFCRKIKAIVGDQNLQLAR